VNPCTPEHYARHLLAVLREHEQGENSHTSFVEAHAVLHEVLKNNAALSTLIALIDLADFQD